MTDSIDCKIGDKYETRQRRWESLAAVETVVLTIFRRATSIQIYVDPMGQANMAGATVTVRDSATKAQLGTGTVAGTAAQRVFRLTKALPFGSFEISITPMGAVNGPILVAARAQGEEPGG